MDEMIVEGIIEALSNDVYDFEDEFTENEIISFVSEAIEKLKTQTVVDVSAGGYRFRINNGKEGFVSCSDSNCTGISRTLYYPYFDDDEVLCGIENLIDMMNEAFVRCVE